MAGLQRFIIYLYKYENDEKKENAGFAKIEIRGSLCILEVHIRNVEKTDCTVYLFARENEIMQSVPVGEVTTRRGNADMRFSFERKDLNAFGVSVEQLEGLFIPFGEGFYIASQWKEGEIKEAYFKIQTKKEENEKELKMEVEEQPEQKTEEIEQGNVQAEEEEEAQQEVEMDTEPKNLKATEIPMEKFTEDETLERIFQKMRLKNTIFFPFDTREIECVRIDIKDLSELPKKYWYLGKNSFLLHGFFNYRYLIMGEIVSEEKKIYFIGVPGVFQNQERIMAAMFGFPEFRTAERAEYKTGNFGYWYRTM